MTTYTEVGPDDHDVALFLVHHLNRINIWRLPLKAWVARQDDEIVAVLTFENVTYPAIHFILNEKFPRPFVRVMKLWLMAYGWFEEIGIPLVCAPVFDHLRHFQALIRKLGFRRVGVETTTTGAVVETIYAYHFKETTDDSIHPTE
jgi:hypothetical protein